MVRFATAFCAMFLLTISVAPALADGKRPRIFIPPGYAPAPVYPGPVFVPIRGGDLERHVERIIRGLGPCIDDVDVDVDTKRGRVEIDVEIRHPAAYGQVQQLVYSIPELRGFRIDLEIDVDD